MLQHSYRHRIECPGRFQKIFLRICALTALFVVVLYAVSMTDMDFSRTDDRNVSTYIKRVINKLQKAITFPKTQRKRRLILLWTSFWGKKTNWLPSPKDLQCPVSNCDVTSNRSLLNQSSAVLFHWRSINVNDLPQCVPSENIHCPIWILLNKEAPPHTPRTTLAKIQDRVHWIATYRKDSDIYAPYGEVVLRKSHSCDSHAEELSNEDIKSDRRLVCWLVSNCNTPSKREKFVTELKEHIEVDIYGKCGNATCPHHLSKDCYQWLSKKCMFYLALENSNCRDYTTEKIYYALSTNMVPIVLGNTSNYAHLPPHSHINANDFSSPKELAKYLAIVGNVKNIYSSYFLWKKTHEIHDYGFQWLCDVCTKLHNTDEKTVKPEKDLVSWWYGQNICDS